MANEIRIKRRLAGGSAGAPASLKTGELAWNQQDNIIYGGFGDAGSGVATSVVVVAGTGAFASLASPAFTGVPTAPTAAANTNTTQLATTAFVIGQANSTAGTIAMNGTQAAGSSALYARADHVHPSDTSRAPLASPTFTGTPSAPTAAVDTNTTQLATTAFVVGQGYLKSATAASTYLTSATAASTYAPLASPALSGTPTAPTAAANTNTTQLATTAFVLGQGNATAGTIAMNGTQAAGTSTLYARADHVHPTDTSRAPLASPTFTGKVTTAAATTGGAGFNAPHGAAPTTPANGDVWTTTTGLFVYLNGVTMQAAPLASPTFTGTPASVTAAVDTNTTQIATTAFVIGQGYAKLASPSLTGTPLSTTAAADTNTTQIATTAFVVGQASSTSPAMNGTATIGTSLRYARADHIHPSDTAKANLASPTFTGTPLSTTAAVDTNTTQIATTAFVLAQASAVTPAALGTAAVGTATRFARADHVHAMPTHSQVGAPTADVAWGSFKLTSLADPVNAQDAATKNYVDSVAQGIDAKQSVKAATTANITLSATQTIDGISVIAGDRVLVKNQTTASQNGVYVVAAGAWARSSDLNLWSELPNAFCFVEEGTTQADTSWVCTANQGGTLETTAVTFVQFGAAGTYLGGNGLVLTGNTFDVVGTANRIIANADSIDIASTYVGQTSITTLGTIATGVWNGTTIAVANGGTGATTLTGLVKGNGTSAFTAAVAGTDYHDTNSTIDGGTF